MCCCYYQKYATLLPQQQHIQSICTEPRMPACCLFSDGSSLQFRTCTGDAMFGELAGEHEADRVLHVAGA